MTVQAKFWVTNINHHAHQAGGGDNQSATVEMQPVYADGANDHWSKWTPTGKIEMTITNPNAIAQFDLGGEYLITFDRANAE